MIENIIFLATFADGGTPPLIDRIKDIPEYAKFIGKIKWFACDSRAIFDNDYNNRITKYSFNQLNELYEEKVKKSKPKSIKYSLNILKFRYLLFIELNKIINSNLHHGEIENLLKPFIIKLKYLNENINKLSLCFNNNKIIGYIEDILWKMREYNKNDLKLIKKLEYFQKIYKLLERISELSIEEILILSKQKLIHLILNQK